MYEMLYMASILSKLWHEPVNGKGYGIWNFEHLRLLRFLFHGICDARFLFEESLWC
jgi:hypothetical protein